MRVWQKLTRHEHKQKEGTEHNCASQAVKKEQTATNMYVVRIPKEKRERNIRNYGSKFLPQLVKHIKPEIHRTQDKCKTKQKNLTYYFQTAEIQKQRKYLEALQGKWKNITKEGTKKGITANFSLKTT